MVKELLVYFLWTLYIHDNVKNRWSKHTANPNQNQHYAMTFAFSPRCEQYKRDVEHRHISRLNALPSRTAQTSLTPSFAKPLDDKTSES